LDKITTYTSLLIKDKKNETMMKINIIGNCSELLNNKLCINNVKNNINSSNNNCCNNNINHNCVNKSIILIKNPSIVTSFDPRRHHYFKSFILGIYLSLYLFNLIYI
jgi:hypothetical protein